MQNGDLPCIEMIAPVRTCLAAAYEKRSSESAMDTVEKAHIFVKQPAEM